jgi:hypothetical protein
VPGLPVALPLQLLASNSSGQVALRNREYHHHLRPCYVAILGIAKCGRTAGKDGLFRSVSMSVYDIAIALLLHDIRHEGLQVSATRALSLLKVGLTLEMARRA